VFSIGDILDLAIQIEKNGEKVYRKAAERASRKSLASLFQSLAHEEVRHAEWFSELKDKVHKTTEDPRLEEMGKKVLQGILGDQTFSLKEAGLEKIEAVEDVLKTAIEFEKDTALFYEMIRSFLNDEETLRHLVTIIEEENRHITLLQEALEEGQWKRP
jgi:rubrerythrin